MRDAATHSSGCTGVCHRIFRRSVLRRTHHSRPPNDFRRHNFPFNDDFYRRSSTLQSSMRPPSSSSPAFSSSDRFRAPCFALNLANASAYTRLNSLQTSCTFSKPGGISYRAAGHLQGVDRYLIANKPYVDEDPSTSTATMPDHCGHHAYHFFT